MKRHAPATERNREPIAAVLTEELPADGLVLEIASGSGEHAVHFARTYPYLHWQPSDPDADARVSIAAWRADAGLENLRAPIALDAASADWPVDHADAVVCINMTHISQQSATEGLFAGTSRILGQGAPLIIYGPFVESAVPTAPSNRAFDEDLRRRDARWGLRDVAWLDALGAHAGLARTRRAVMPANNLTLVYRRM